MLLIAHLAVENVGCYGGVNVIIADVDVEVKQVFKHTRLLQQPCGKQGTCPSPLAGTASFGNQPLRT